jgi:hypothetical protein
MRQSKEQKPKPVEVRDDEKAEMVEKPSRSDLLTPLDKGKQQQSVSFSASVKVEDCEGGKSNPELPESRVGSNWICLDEEETSGVSDVDAIIQARSLSSAKRAPSKFDDETYGDRADSSLSVTKKTKCNFCEDGDHPYGKCPNWKKRCNRCHEIGHIAKECQGKSKRKNDKPRSNSKNRSRPNSRNQSRSNSRERFDNGSERTDIFSELFKQEFQPVDKDAVLGYINSCGKDEFLEIFKHMCSSAVPEGQAMLVSKNKGHVSFIKTGAPNKRR